MKSIKSTKLIRFINSAKLIMLIKFILLLLIFTSTISLCCLADSTDIDVTSPEETESILSINEYEESLESSYLTRIEEEEKVIEEEVPALETEDNIEEKISTEGEISLNDEDDFVDVSTNSNIKEVETNLDEEVLFSAGNHTSVASPSIVINTTYDRYEIYSGENAGTVVISDDNGTYYNGDTIVKVIRDLEDTNNNSPILLKLDGNTLFFDFDNSNDNYVLLPDGFVEDLIMRESGNGYLNPQDVSRLDHIKVDLSFNGSDLGKYDLFEYGVLYYLSCYEGVLGEYYYYDPSSTDIDKATSFYINNKIMNRTYSIVPEYNYRNIDGEQSSFKPSWIINSDNLTNANKEKYVLQWVTFPYFLIKTGEKYWNIRDMIEQSTYLSEYAEGYYEQYLTERPYGNIAERLVILDNIYKTENSLLNDATSNVAVHSYNKSDTVKITGNFRADTNNSANKLRAGGVISYDTNLIINLEVNERRARSVQVYLNGQKLISNSNQGLHTLTNGKCQIVIDSSKLVEEENSRNVLSFLLLNETGNYLTDVKGRVINNYISIIRHSSIRKNTYTVIFNTNGAGSITNIRVEEGNKLSMPTNPGKNGFTFSGWYEDDKLTKKFDVNEYITSDKRLYASWTQVIKYSSGGSSRSVGGGGGGGGGGAVTGGAVSGNTLQGVFPLTFPSMPTNTLLPNETITAASGGLNGNWVQVGNTKKFTDTAGNTYKDKWASIPNIKGHTDWYKFDKDGFVTIGFYNENGKVFYFDIGDKNKDDLGKMATGWKLLKHTDGKDYYYYFNEDGIGETKGALLTNGTTKDGAKVDSYGRWVIDGVPQAYTIP